MFSTLWGNNSIFPDYSLKEA